MSAIEHYGRSGVRFLVALVWLVNGLWCKVLGMVPRHEDIVAAILGAEVAHPMILAIGVAEIGMAVWVMSGWRYHACATLQVLIILTMNVLEFLLAPHLLLWGHWNLLFAALLCGLIIWSALPLKQRSHA